MRRVAGGFALALACASGLLAGGCASARSSPPRYIAAADAICTSELAALNALPQPGTAQQALSYLPRATAIMRRENSELAAIRPEASRRAQFLAALASTRQLAAVLSRFLHQLRAGIVELSTYGQVQAQGGALRADIDKHFRQAGLQRCSE